MKTKTIVWLLIAIIAILAAAEFYVFGLSIFMECRIFALFWLIMVAISFCYDLLTRQRFKVIYRDLVGGLLLAIFILCVFGLPTLIMQIYPGNSDDVLLLSATIGFSILPLLIYAVAFYLYLHYFSGLKEQLDRLRES